LALECGDPHRFGFLFLFLAVVAIPKEAGKGKEDKS
jgi:hypothetical protein